MPRALADGKTKVAILTTKPADPFAPTVAELEAGIDAACSLLDSDFRWSATASDTETEKALCVAGNASVLGASNFEATVTVFRYFEADGTVDLTEDAVFQALMVKGTEVWVYVRETSKGSREPWAAEDEVRLGGHVITDTPQASSTRTGYIKATIPVAFQEGYPYVTVVAAVPDEGGVPAG